MNSENENAVKSDERPWNDAELLRRLYHEEGMSQRAIASELDCSPSVIHRSMVRNDIERREHRVDYAAFYTSTSGYEIWVTRDGYDQDQVLVHQLLAIAAGEKPLDVFDESMHVHHRNGIPWDNRPENLELLTISQHSPHHARERWGESPWRDGDLFERMYVSEEKSLAEMAAEFGCDRSTVGEWRVRHGIELREQGFPEAAYRDEESLRELYLDRGLSITQIADRCDCSHVTVWNWLNKHGIPTRGDD